MSFQAGGLPSTGVDEGVAATSGNAAQFPGSAAPAEGASLTVAACVNIENTSSPTLTTPTLTTPTLTSESVRTGTIAGAFPTVECYAATTATLTTHSQTLTPATPTNVVSINIGANPNTNQPKRKR